MSAFDLALDAVAGFTAWVLVAVLGILQVALPLILAILLGSSPPAERGSATTPEPSPMPGPSEIADQLGCAADAAVAAEMLARQSAARRLHADAHRALERARLLTDRAGTIQFAANHAMTAMFYTYYRADPAAVVRLLEARIAADGVVGSSGEPPGVTPDLVEACIALGRRDEAIALAERFAAVTPPSASTWPRALRESPRAFTARRIRALTDSSPPSPQSRTARRSPAGPAPGRPGWRWRSLIEAAQDRWRVVNGPHLVTLVRTGAAFVYGKLIERPDDHHQPEAA